MRQDEHAPSFFERLLRELRRLCEESQSGTLFITTEENHSARFMLQKGAIVGMVYRTKNGLGALPFIKGITSGTYTFSTDRVFLSSAETGAAPLPATVEIFRLLGVPLEPLAHPSAPAQPVAAPAPAAPPPPVARAPSAGKVLLVEDSTVTRKLIAKILIDGGFAVVEAENGLAAFAQLNEEKPDLMLLDVIMPGIDGYKVLSMVRKHDTFKNLPIVMLTSRDGLFDKLRGRFGGSDEYLTKPFTPKQLLDKISKYIKR